MTTEKSSVPGGRTDQKTCQGCKKLRQEATPCRRNYHQFRDAHVFRVGLLSKIIIQNSCTGLCLKNESELMRETRGFPYTVFLKESKMKGVIFTEFLGFIESQFGLPMVDHLITATNPESGGSYTSVGTYSANELVAMVVELGKKTGAPVPGLIKTFGSHLFNHFVEAHSETLGDVKSTEELLSQVENRIHVEVRKLFPDAELPTIGFVEVEPNVSEVIYESKRPFADLAEGLIAAAIEHFKDPIVLTREDFPPADGTHAKFTMVRS